MLLSMGLFSWFYIWIVHSACTYLMLITLIVFCLTVWLPEAEEVKKEQDYPKPHWRNWEDTSLSQGIHGTGSFNGRRKWSSEGQCSGSPWLADRIAQSWPVSSPGEPSFFLWSLRRERRISVGLSYRIAEPVYRYHMYALIFSIKDHLILPLCV